MEILHVGFGAKVGSLESMVDELGRCLSLDRFARHESSNYPDGIYYLAKADGIDYRVSIEDDYGFDDSDCWLVLAGKELNAEAKERAIRQLLLHGHVVECAVDEASDYDSGQVAKEIFDLREDGSLASRLKKVRF